MSSFLSSKSIMTNWCPFSLFCPKVTEYYKLKYPEDKEKIVKLLKKHKLYDKFININYLKLNSQILEGNLPKDISKIPEKEKDYRVTLSKKD